MECVDERGWERVMVGRSQDKASILPDKHELWDKALGPWKLSFLTCEMGPHAALNKLKTVLLFASKGE